VQDAARVPEIAALIEALRYMVNHAEWREQNEGVYLDATDKARAALRAIADAKCPARP